MQIDRVGFIAMTSHFGRCDVISHNKVLPPGEWKQIICRHLWCSVRQWYLLHYCISVQLSVHEQGRRCICMWLVEHSMT